MFFPGFMQTITLQQLGALINSRVKITAEGAKELIAQSDLRREGDWLKIEAEKATDALTVPLLLVGLKVYFPCGASTPSICVANIRAFQQFLEKVTVEDAKSEDGMLAIYLIWECLYTSALVARAERKKFLPAHEVTALGVFASALTRLGFEELSTKCRDLCVYGKAGLLWEYLEVCFYLNVHDEAGAVGVHFHYHGLTSSDSYTQRWNWALTLLVLLERKKTQYPAAASLSDLYRQYLLQASAACEATLAVMSRQNLGATADGYMSMAKYARRIRERLGNQKGKEPCLFTDSWRHRGVIGQYFHQGGTISSTAYYARWQEPMKIAKELASKGKELPSTRKLLAQYSQYLREAAAACDGVCYYLKQLYPQDYPHTKFSLMLSTTRLIRRQLVSL